MYRPRTNLCRCHANVRPVAYVLLLPKRQHARPRKRSKFPPFSRTHRIISRREIPGSSDTIANRGEIVGLVTFREGCDSTGPEFRAIMDTGGLAISPLCRAAPRAVSPYIYMDRSWTRGLKYSGQ